MSDRTVYYDSENRVWVNKRNDATRATSRHSTRREATNRPKSDLRNSGGGELTVKNKGTGQFGQKDTVPPADDPFPPRG